MMKLDYQNFRTNIVYMLFELETMSVVDTIVIDRNRFKFVSVAPRRIAIEKWFDQLKSRKYVLLDEINCDDTELNYVENNPTGITI